MDIERLYATAQNYYCEDRGRVSKEKYMLCSFPCVFYPRWSKNYLAHCVVGRELSRIASGHAGVSRAGRRGPHVRRARRPQWHRRAAPALVRGHNCINTRSFNRHLTRMLAPIELLLWKYSFFRAVNDIKALCLQL